MRDLWLKFFWAINILMYLALIALWISIPDELTLNLSASVFNLCLTAFLIYFSREQFKNYYESPQFRSLSSAILSAFLVLGILGLVNYLIFKHPTQWDFSENDINSLTEQTEKIVKSVEGPMTFKIFATKAQAGAIRPLAELYRTEKNDLAVEVIDIELRPDLVEQYGVDTPGTIVVEHGEKQAKVTTLDELHITNAIIKVTREFDPVLYYVTGHGEKSLTQKDNYGVSHLKTLIENSSYRLKEINLSTIKSIPETVNAVIIWGPKSGFHQKELELLKSYLAGGGNLMVALDPNFNETTAVDLRELLANKGAKVANNLVIDRVKHINGSNGTVPIAAKFDDSHPVTKDIARKAQTTSIFFPLVSSVTEDHKIENGFFTPLVLSSPFPASWGENSPNEFVQGKVQFSEETDIKGPVPMAGALELDKGDQKILVFGNSTFVINTYQKFGANFTLFLNGLSWLVEEDRLASFNLPVIDDSPVFISSPQLGIIFYFSVIFAPLVLFGFAFFIYRKRRKL